MKAFHNNSLIKELYLTRLNKHYKADEIIQGKYWENGKGCAVGCTIHSSDHKNYESKLGIPEDIAHLQDSIFENLPNKLAKQFPLEFLSAIKVGADLKNVKNLFTIWVLTDEKYGVIKYADNKKIVQDIADAFSRDMVSPVPSKEWEELRKNAIAAYSVSKCDVYSDSAAAYYAAAASVFSTTAIFYYAAAAYFVSAAYSAKNTKSEWYIAASNKLIELLKNSN